MKRILVIDDDDTLRAMLRRLFSTAGYEVAVAGDGVEGVRIQQAQPFDLIMTDLVMPEKEGLEVIMEIRKNYPATKIIAMSGGGRIHPDQYLELARSLGAKRVFSKPFKAGEVLAAVRELLTEED
jgi:DNA-binding response OmpR family regulator